MTRPWRLRPVDVLRTLADLLRTRGITRLYGSACAMLGVLSVAYGLSVWCDGRQLWWHRDGERTTWPARDPDGAASLLIELAQDPGSAEPPNGL
jgi:hypothetical protein